MAAKPYTPDPSDWDAVRDPARMMTGGIAGSNPHRSKTFTPGRSEHFAAGAGQALSGSKWARPNKEI